MHHHAKFGSMEEMGEQLQPQTKKSGIYHGINTGDAEPSVVKSLLNEPSLARDLLSPHLDVDQLSRFARVCPVGQAFSQILC